jgi:hypothetical protein
VAVPAGVKTFTAGAVLTASEVNTFLMAQVIPVFVDATAANAAMPTPSEGQFRFLRDTDSFEVFTGSAFVAAGGSGADDFQNTFLLMGA